MTAEKWSLGLDERLRELFATGFSNSSIAEALTNDTGRVITADAVKNRAARIGLEKDHANGAAALFQQPREYNHLELGRLTEGSRVLIAFNDMQIPFQDDATVDAVLKFARDFEPTHLVVPGDGFDFYLMSDFDKNPSRQFRFKEELEIGHKIIKRIELATPKADRYWIDGNHEDRLRRWLWRHGAALSNLPSLEPAQLMHLDPDDWTHLKYGSSLNVMGCVIEHGEGGTANMAPRMFARRGTSGLCGHSHRLHDYHVTNAGGTHRYIENGCMCSLRPEFIARPNWQHAFTYAIVKGGKIQMFPTLVTPSGFRVEGHWYKRQQE